MLLDGWWDNMAEHKCTNPYCGDRKESELETHENPSIDARVMVEGLTQELTATLKLNFNDLENDLEKVIALLGTVIDARIDLYAAQMKPIIEMSGNKKVVIAGLKLGDYDIKSDAPAFIPLTETIPGIVRPGDRFNHKGQTMHVVFEKEYIPGLRELKWDPIEYEPVKPGNPWNEKVKDAE